MRYHYRPPPANHLLLRRAPSAHLVLTAQPLPPSIDYRPRLLPVRNQLQEGACSGFSTAAHREGLDAKGYLSPAYLYGRTRMVEGTFPSDSGATIADEFGVLQAYGVCPESFLPYKADPSEAPSPVCDVAAVPFRISQPLAVDWSDASNIKQVLAAGKLITIGFAVYQSFEATGADGVVPPVSGDLLGGHGVLVCGYDDVAANWIIRNQWGADWGSGGYCFMPYGYEDETWQEAWTS